MIRTNRMRRRTEPSAQAPGKLMTGAEIFVRSPDRGEGRGGLRLSRRSDDRRVRCPARHLGHQARPDPPRAGRDACGRRIRESDRANRASSW